MGKIKYQWIIFLFIIYKVESAANTIGVEDICFLSKEQNGLRDQFKKSFTCSRAEYASEIINSIPLDVEELIIANSTINEDLEFKVDNKTSLDALISVKIIDSFIGSTLFKWIKNAPNLQYLEFQDSATSVTINHEGIAMTTIDLELSSFKNLKKLRISGGNITNLDIRGLDETPILDLSDNDFECRHDFTWLITLSEETDKITLNNTICFIKQLKEKKVHYPILYTLWNKPFINVMQYKREAILNCPPKCQCNLNGMTTKERPQLNVECIGINMTKLPDIIPRGSTRCNFSYNFIEDLTPLYVNHIYDNVGMMALSHNSISYLDPVRFPDFLRSRRDVGFWLDHNKVTKFPAESVKKVYDEARKHKRFTPQFFLGHNPWICSCDYIEDFQSMIYQHMYDIYDERDVRCSDQDPYNPGVMVLAVDVAALCTREPWINTMDVVNLLLALVLLLLIADFTYNYRQYKKNRKLPWVVTKFKC